MAGDERTFVVVGAALAGAKAVETLRAEGFTGRIVLVGAEPELPYERPPLSKGYLLGRQERAEAFVHDRQWYRDQDITLMLGRRATALDRAARTVTVSRPIGGSGTDAAGTPAAGDGPDTIRYDALLLATGSRVRRLDVPGADLDGVRYLRTMPDATDLLGRLHAGAQVVVVGAGWIGLEVAAAARSHGCAVTVVEAAHLPLHRVLGDEVATVYRDVHLAHGVDFRFGLGIREFGGDSADRLVDAVLDDGTEIPADLAVVGVGVLPEVELARTAGLAVDRGIATDSRLRTSDPHIFACGDCAAWQHPLLGVRVHVEHWANALDGGPAAARSMLGLDVSYDRLPYFFTDQYETSPMIGMEYSGHVDPGGYDQVVFRGDPSVAAGRDPEFIAFWVRDGRVIAGMNVNVWDVNETVQALVRAGYQDRPVDLARLADPGVPLESLLA